MNPYSKGGRNRRGRGKDTAGRDNKSRRSASSSQGDIAPSQRGYCPQEGRKEPTDVPDYLSSGKVQPNFSAALKEPVLHGLKKDKEEQIIILQKGDGRLFSSLNLLADIYFEPEARFPLIGGNNSLSSK